MSLQPAAWLRWLDAQPAGLERGAIPSDPARRAQAAALMAALDLPSQELYPWGLEAGHRLWQPWAQARDRVEALDLEAFAAQADWIVHDPEARTLRLATLAPLPSRCPRFAAYQCPRMVPMGHESGAPDCDYWAWEGMAAAAPGVELFPEWQRFDCSKYHALFQLHLCAVALAQDLKADWRIEAYGPDAAAGKLLQAYAGLTATPGAFSFTAIAD